MVRTMARLDKAEQSLQGAGPVFNACGVLGTGSF
jgi:hypothetical protein